MADTEGKRTINALAPLKWAELKSALKRAAVAFSPFRVEIQERACAISLTRYHGDLPIATLTVTFDPAVPRILFRCAPHHRTGEVAMVLYDNQPSFVIDGIIRQNEDELSARLLSYLIGRR